MITKRYPEPRGLHSDQPDYGFYVRVSGADRELLKQASSILAGRLGDKPSNPVLLAEMVRTFIASNHAAQPEVSEDFEDFI